METSTHTRVVDCGLPMAIQFCTLSEETIRNTEFSAAKVSNVHSRTTLCGLRAYGNPVLHLSQEICSNPAFSAAKVSEVFCTQNALSTMPASW
jgi:hypothetical protein